MDQFNEALETFNGYIWTDWMLYILLAVGLLFTIWSGFSQFRALTHGVAVTAGKYDNPDDPGAISHFQALSAALSATVGLGNIAGVAIAIAIGGPGAVFWMWVVGFVGMALKSTEVTQSMLFRDTSEPDNPHGGPMFVVAKGMKKWGLGAIGQFIGVLFCLTLLVSAVTGGNMFQAWSVGDITREVTDIPEYVTGLILAVIVAMVIIGGIKRIGSVAGVLVPFMCVLYVIIVIFAPLSGAHFNPAVTIADAWQGNRPWSDVGPYIATQIAGGAVGVILANLMFELDAVEWSTKARDGYGQYIGEAVATFGLVLLIFLLVRGGRDQLAAGAVAAYIGGAYWFTSSTSFANPAVTLARTMSDTFAGIDPTSAPAFVGMQLIGMALAVGAARVLYP